MPGFAPIGTTPVAASNTTIVVTGPTQAKSWQPYWRVRSTISLVSTGAGLHRASIQRKVSLHGIRRRQTSPLGLAQGVPQKPSRQMQAALQRFIQTYHVAHKPWRPPRKNTKRIIRNAPSRTSWIGTEVLHGGNAFGHVSWMGLEILHVGSAAGHISWIGVEALHIGSAVAHISMICVEVLRSVRAQDDEEVTHIF